MYNENVNHPTKMIINLDNFKHNINEIKKYCKNSEIMPVFKANAYGTYLNTRLDILNMFSIVAVANPSEGMFLRKIGYKKEIMILNQPDKDEIDNIINNNLIVGVSSNDFIDELGKHKKKVMVHIEIGTGMGRTGINPKRSLEYVNHIKKYKNIIIDGIYTHLSSADSDFVYTRKQLNNFNDAIKIIKENVNTIRYIHSSSSNGLLNFPDSHYNLVRPGLIIYGYPSCDKININIKPIIKLKSKITFLKTVPKGTSIGYGRKYITKKESLIATIPIGYADGLNRLLSNKGHVIINNKKVKIIGNICMDSIMVDVTNIKNVKLYDEVYIWDNDIIKVEDISKMIKTINYEIICTISPRIPRIFVNKKNESI